jgi:uncharacterized protein (TIGR01777 family)
MKILVTGATGLIGKALCTQLAGEGHEIAILTRRKQSESPYRIYQWDPESGPAPAAALAGRDAVIHLAGEPVAEGRWTDEKKRRSRESRVTGTRNLVAGMRAVKDGPPVLVSGSAVGYYGSRGDEKLDERSRPGVGFLSEVCIEWENEALKAAESGVRVALVRTGLVLAREGGALAKMLPIFRLGFAGSLGDGRQWFPWIHRDDEVGIIRHALLSDAVKGPINAAAPGIVTNQEFTKTLADILDRPAFLSVPEFMLNLIFGEMGEAVLASQRMIPSVAEETKYAFRFPTLKAALVDLLGHE